MAIILYKRKISMALSKKGFEKDYFNDKYTKISYSKGPVTVVIGDDDITVIIGNEIVNIDIYSKIVQ
jgi:hypothetical protein